MYQKRLIEYISDYRKDNHLTQSELADILHVSRQSVSSWETGKSLPSADVLPSLSELLGFSKKELFKLWETETEHMYLSEEDIEPKDQNKIPETDYPGNDGVREFDRLTNQINKQSKQVDSIKKSIEKQQTAQTTEMQKSLEESQAKQLQQIKESLAESQSKQLESITTSIENAKSGIGWKEVALILLFVILEWLSWELRPHGVVFALAAVFCRPKFEDKVVTKMFFLFSLVWLFMMGLFTWWWFFGLPSIHRVEKID